MIVSGIKPSSKEFVLTIENDSEKPKETIHEQNKETKDKIK